MSRVWRPHDINRMRKGIRAATAVLDVPTDISTRRKQALCELAMFLVRSALYLACLERGEVVFAMSRVAQVLGDSRIATTWQRTCAQRDSDEVLHELKGLLDSYCGIVTNPFGSLEALAVSWYTKYPIASEMALRILNDEVRLDYTRCPAVWVGPEVA